jgi:ABC-type phosphate/phosphonate transport system substrate-binding protein
MRKAMLICVFLLAGKAFAGPHDFVIQLARVGGDEQSAQPYIDQVMRYAEQALGWPPNSAHGKFAGKEPAAVAYIEEQKPGFGIFDPETFLSLHKKYNLQPIATVKIANHKTDHLYVVVKDPKVKKLADLKDKTILSPYVGNPRFLSRVAFYKDGVDFEKDVKLQFKASAQTALKAVRDGTADATIVDDDQVAAMAGISKELRTVATSPQLPGTPAVAFGAHPDADKFQKMLLSMCAKGGDLCKNLFIEKFTPPEKAAYDDAVRRYEK